MTKPASTSFHDQATTLRQLKVLVAVLVVSNLGLGLISFFLLRALDRNYSDLIGHSVPVQSDLQTLTAAAVEALRGTGPALFNATGNQRLAILQRSRTAIDRDRDLRQRLLASGSFSVAPEVRTEFEAAGEAFRRGAGEVLNLVAAGKAAEAVHLRDNSLRPAFDRYLGVITRASDFVEEDSLKASRALSEKTSTRSVVLLGIASWPVIILGALLLLTAVFVIVLMVLFRGREMSDMP
jgi:hypothetical protein